MNEQHESPQRGREILRGIIDGAEQSIAEELTRTAPENDWLDCFGSIVYGLELHMARSDVRQDLDPELMDSVKQQVTELMGMYRMKRMEHPAGTEIPDAVKEELLTSLYEIRDAIPI